VLELFFKAVVGADIEIAVEQRVAGFVEVLAGLVGLAGSVGG
jgi:hypothetical protein